MARADKSAGEGTPFPDRRRVSS